MRNHAIELTRVFRLRSRTSRNSRSPEIEPRRHPNPNPGYLGPSSHAAIFNQLVLEDSEGGDQRSTSHDPAAPLLESISVELRPVLEQIEKGVNQHLRPRDLHAMEGLVTLWLSRGVNLALAEIFVAPCAQSSNFSRASSVKDASWGAQLTNSLLANSMKPLYLTPDTSFEEFTAQFTAESSRFETLGIFLTAVFRASMDVEFFPGLYSSDREKRNFRNAVTRLSDNCLDICLSLDSLNDMQLVLQYENFILHSYVDGDQSK